MYNLLANEIGKGKKSNQRNTRFRNKIICNANCLYATSREGNPLPIRWYGQLYGYPMGVYRGLLTYVRNKRVCAVDLDLVGRKASQALKMAYLCGLWGFFCLSFWLLQSIGPFYGYSHFYGGYWERVATFYIKADARKVAWLSHFWLQKPISGQLRRGHYLLPFCHQKLPQRNPSRRIQKGPSNFPSNNFQTTPKTSFST